MGRSLHTQRHRSGHNRADSKFRRDLGISSPRKPLLILGFQNSKSNTFMFSLLLFSPKDFWVLWKRREWQAEIDTERYRSGHNGADSKSCFHFGSPNCRKASNHAGLRASSNCELGSVLSCCSSQFPRLEFCGKMAIMRAAI